MLSNKMTFSLMSLITILALAFVVTPAMAADDFDATFSVNSTTYDADIIVTLTFGENVGLTNAQAILNSDVTKNLLSVRVVDANGSEASLTTGDSPVLDSEDITAKDINTHVDGVQTEGKAFMFTVPSANVPDTSRKLLLSVKAGVAEANPLSEKSSKKGELAVDLGAALADDANRPKVVSIQRLRPGSQTVVAAFQEAKVTGAFDIRIVLTENPKDGLKLAHIKVDNGTASGLVAGVPFAQQNNADGDADSTVVPHPIEGMYAHSGAAEDGLAGVPEGEMGNVPSPSGPDNLYHQYRATITPHRRADKVKISIKAFHDGASPYNNYYQPINLDIKPNGREQLELAVAIPAFDLEDGYKVVLPHSEGAQITYANGTAGHYILTYNKDGSHIRHFHEKDEENKATKQTPAQLLYNVRATDKLPNLETFFANSGIVHLVSYGSHAAGAAYISEVMWGTDASQEPVNASNWIEIRNGTSAAIGIAENMWALWFYEAHETPATAYPADSAYEGPTGQAGTIIDVIGTKDAKGLTWSIAGKGQSGRSNIDIARAEEHVLTPTTPLKSMYRMMVADTSATATAGAMMPGEGQMAATWVQTQPPAVNLAIGRENAIVATPGSAPITTAEQIAAVEKKEEAAEKKIETTGTIPAAGQIYISEIMFAGGGTLPQWIEISNGSRTEEVNLSGWTLTVNNAAADADVSIGASAKFTIPDGTTIDMSGQQNSASTILVVTEAGRNNVDASGQVVNLMKDNEVDLILAGVTKRKYTLLSGMAFEITLAPPEPAKATPPAGETVAAKATREAAAKKATAIRKAASDTVGNLGADGAAAWALPMSEDGRSSILRKHIQVSVGPAEPEDGTMMNNWVLASDTSFAQPTHIRTVTYYGAQTDSGTPGFRAGGALPVELSHFRPARNKETGAVVITWSTQSELNNAGFFIKRSQQADGEFKVINAAMVPGAGTTSEKQFYTYSDTTAQPNVVYYYQIEDVSLDGNRQTLTRGIRLKGHVSVAGKATLTWGELKSSHQ